MVDLDKSRKDAADRAESTGMSPVSPEGAIVLASRTLASALIYIGDCIREPGGFRHGQ